MAKLFPCLWFNGDAEEAAGFYATLLPDSHVDMTPPASAAKHRRSWLATRNAPRDPRWRRMPWIAQPGPGRSAIIET